MAGQYYWGVDSAAAATTKIHVGKGKTATLFDYVTDSLKRMPSYWGRYIGGRYQITPDEADYIFERSEGQCRILVVYNGTHDSKNSVQGNFDAGVRDANNAMLAAASVGVPGGVMIWGDVEGVWQPTAEWFQGWWDGMYKSPYAGMGGIYCRPTIPQLYEPYLKALIASTPKKQTDQLFNPFARKRADRAVTVVLPDPPDRMRLLWGTQPQKFSWSNPATDMMDFSPSNPPPLPGSVALWQYHDSFLKPPGDSAAKPSGDATVKKKKASGGLIDMDLADQRAYDRMWKSTSARIIDPFAKKQ
jgi:hypothetical protein